MWSMPQPMRNCKPLKLNYPMYEKTSVWVAKIVTYPDDWNTRYIEDKWDDYSFYATRDLA